jgi:alpha-L-arabinofuranosidase
MMHPHTLLTIDATDPTAGAPLPRYGVFFEDYNHGGDGGLYAELVRNRSFEDGETPEAWAIFGAGAQMALDRSQPLNAHNPTALRLDLASGSLIRLVNEGYWGMALWEGARYRLSLYARTRRGDESHELHELARIDENSCNSCNSWPSPVGIHSIAVAVQEAGGTLHRVATIEGINETWGQLTCEFVSPITDARARLALLAEGPGMLWLDMVSLLPTDTWRGRANGMRRDIAELIAALRPAFVRFPGGTNLEGSTRENALRWKRSVGDVAERPGVMQFWGYRLTEGIGHHELLQWCEDLDAAPLFTINCGLMAQWKTDELVPLDELQPWVQDALDAIAYANAPVEDEWGALRDRFDHPAPFNLRYIEIGNEHAGPPYEERFARFYDAIKARFPAIQVIATCHLNERTPDLVDEHYYGSPRRLAELTHWFDRYERTGPKIIVTEYAVTVGGGMGSWEAALAEAAFLTGVERNGDVVEMVCYGGLFGSLDDPARTWDPNAIYHTTDACYGTPSFHLQRLFAEQRGSHNLPTRLTLATPEEPAREFGGIGLGSLTTEVEFRDIEVWADGGRVLHASGGPTMDGWRQWHGPRPNVEDVRFAAGDAGWEDGTIRFKARKLAGVEGWRVFFHLRDERNWHCWRLGAWRNTRHVLERCANGVTDVLGSEASGAVEAGRWYDVRVELRGARIRCFLDETLVMDYERAPNTALAASAAYEETTGAVIVKLVNRASEPRTITIDLQGRSTPPEGIELTMGGEPAWEHSLAQPERIIPVSRPLGGIQQPFAYTMAPHTVAVLRLPTENEPKE